MKIGSGIPLCLAALVFALAMPAGAAPDTTAPEATPPPIGSPAPRAEDETYGPDEIVHKAADFFGATTEAVAKAVESVFAKYGRPNAYVAGSEGSGAFIVGLRYGEGDLYMKANGDRATK